jgi:formylglycine-generating enzyme required for sulfatase activity
MKNVLRSFGFITLAAVMGFSLVTCDTGAGPGPGGGDSKNIYALDISKTSKWNTNWDYLVFDKAGSSMVFKVNETTGIPSRLYLKPKKDSDDGYTILFKDNGLPNAVIRNGFIMCFGNFKDYTFDLAIIYPDGNIEYHYDIQTDRNFAALINKRAVSNQGRSAFSDFTDCLSYASLAIDIGTCVLSTVMPPLLLECLPFLVGELGHFLADNYLDGVNQDIANTMIDALDCASNFNIGGALDVVGFADACISAFTSLVDLLMGKDIADAEQWNIYTAIERIEKLAIDMVYVPGGSFEMGSTQYTNESPVHTVTLTDFYIGKYEVTQALWKAVMGSLPRLMLQNNPPHKDIGDNYPVYFVSLWEAMVFCNRLSMAKGLSPAYLISGSTNPDIWGDIPNSETSQLILNAWLAPQIDISSDGYCLPTEAQWEYASKGGNTPGNYKYSGSDNASDVAWHMGNAQGATHEVGQKQPNGLGIYDMSGNVNEWCWDLYARYSSDSQTDPTGPAFNESNSRTIRGGGVGDDLSSLRSTYRFGNGPGALSDRLGFRLARPNSSKAPTTVTVAVTGVTLNQSTLTLPAGEMRTLTATVAPASATNRSVTWSSSNPTVATVTSGRVIARAAGTATITVSTTDGGKKATCVVTVTSGGAAPGPSPSTDYTGSYSGILYASDYSQWDTEVTLTADAISGEDISISNVSIGSNNVISAGGTNIGTWAYVYSESAKIGIVCAFSSGSPSGILIIGKSQVDDSASLSEKGIVPVTLDMDDSYQGNLIKD